jgi:SAM-dependent methyltransferase
MSLRFHEIAESDHRILNPITEDKLALLGEICRLESGMRQLDLACGKGEMLCQWARRWGIGGIGVDISKVFLTAARQRAIELSVDQRVSFIEADAGTYVSETGKFDIVSCLGATWIGGGLVGTLQWMLKAVRPDGLLLVGEPYWITAPPDAAYVSAGIAKNDFASLNGTLERCESLGLELVEMVLASPDSWDRYAAAQWWTVNQWIKDNPNDPERQAIGEWIANNRHDYLQYGRQYLGWGVFVLKQKPG